MKQKLFSIFALLLMAATGAWAQSAFTAKEIKSASQLTSTDDEAYVAACMPSDFLAVDENVAKAWTGAPTDDSAMLIYAIEGNKIKMARFLNGDNKATFGETWSIATFKIQLPNAKFFYTAPPTYSITLAEGTEDEGNWTISPKEATAGSPVTATYSGEKKVKSVKAVKKAVAPRPLAEAVAADLGKIAGADGNIYDSKAAAETAGTTAVAMIAYVGSSTDHATYTHGLAIALADESSSDWLVAMGTCQGKSAVTNAAWQLPSQNQWKAMFKANGGKEDDYTGLQTAANNAGGDGTLLNGSSFWTSTENENEGNAYSVALPSGNSSVNFYSDPKTTYWQVRAVLVF